jgi:hypothetical protein
MDETPSGVSGNIRRSEMMTKEEFLIEKNKRSQKGSKDRKFWKSYSYSQYKKDIAHINYVDDKLHILKESRR